MEIIGWLIIGLIAGGLASLVVPGRTPLGCIGVILVGIAGGILGGILFDALFSADELSFVGSLLAAFVGAVIILFVIRAISKR